MTSLFQGWRDAANWNDLRQVPSLRAEGDWRSDPTLTRRAVLDSLVGLNPGAWYAIADLVTEIKAHDPDFQRPDGELLPLVSTRRRLGELPLRLRVVG